MRKTFLSVQFGIANIHQEDYNKYVRSHLVYFGYCLIVGSLALGNLGLTSMTNVGHGSYHLGVKSGEGAASPVPTPLYT